MMLSSANRREDAARCRELGVAAYLTKPIRQSTLLDAIMTALGSSASVADRDRRGGPSGAAREGRRTLRLLLAEDNAVNQRLAVRLLEKRGHQVVVAGNGREALAALDDRPVRRRADGRADAGDGRLRGDRRHPRPRGGDGRPYPDHRHDRPRHEGRPRALPGGGHGRLRLQAAPAPGALRGPGGPVAAAGSDRARAGRAGVRARRLRPGRGPGARGRGRGAVEGAGGALPRANARNGWRRSGRRSTSGTPRGSSRRPIPQGLGGQLRGPRGRRGGRSDSRRRARAGLGSSGGRTGPRSRRRSAASSRPSSSSAPRRASWRRARIARDPSPVPGGATDEDLDRGRRSVSRRLLQNYLQKWGYEVTAAQDGAEAWRLFEAGSSPWSSPTG